MPQQVETEVGVAVRKLHFLGGVCGWAYPINGEKSKNMPVVKVTLHFRNGGIQEMVSRNGVEYADHIAERPRFEVPGSKPAPGLVHGGQVRWFTREVKPRDVIDRVPFQSCDNGVAPALAVVTAELEPSAIE